MPTSTIYPNGQTLVSSAITQSAISTLLQQLTLGALGLNPPGTVLAYDQVRVDWQTQGQPYQDEAMQRCYVACVPVDDPYSRVRNLTIDGALVPIPAATQTWTYTRAWTTTWHFYGPSSTDDARAVHTAAFMDWFTDALAASNVFLVTDFKEPQCVPELINAQWWGHAVFEVTMYEGAVETIQPGVATSVEVKVYDQDSTSAADTVADITVSAV